MIQELITKMEGEKRAEEEKGGAIFNEYTPCFIIILL